MLSAYQWIVSNWGTIAPFLALVLPFFVKIPFIEHSTAAQIVFDLILKLLPSTPTNAPQSAQEVERLANPKK